MTTYIETFQDGKKLLGSDFTVIVRNATPRKIANAKNNLESYLKRLVNIKPYLSAGWEIKSETV